MLEASRLPACSRHEKDARKSADSHGGWRDPSEVRRFANRKPTRACTGHIRHPWRGQGQPRYKWDRLRRLAAFAQRQNGRSSSVPVDQAELRAPSLAGPLRDATKKTSVQRRSGFDFL